MDGEGRCCTGFGLFNVPSVVVVEAGVAGGIGCTDLDAVNQGCARI